MWLFGKIQFNMVHIVISALLIISPIAVLIRMYYLIKRKTEQDDCRHKNTFTAVAHVVVTCETTTITCLDCGKKLKTETDCR
ncbi:hypothetical protein KU06062659_1320005 [Flavobacterium psychrophilum]|nr:hypothetical protein KU06062659_1320005 [Flavobacterium psychrophilum]SNB26582.1 hypothetical protein NO004_40077 [Flavobacterium psychrophilum]